MLERQLSAIIAQHLNKFLRNVPEEQLNVSLWAGEVVLENVALQEDVFDQLSLLLLRSSMKGNLSAANAEMASLLIPFTVVRGVVRKLRIVLPWSALESEPISVEVEGIDVVLGPLRSRPFDHEEEEKRQAAVREVQLSVFDAPPPESLLGGGAKGSPLGAQTVTGLASSFVDRLLSIVMRNIQITMRDIRVGFAFDYEGLHPSLASNIDICIEEVLIVPADEEWRPRFIQTTSISQCRIIHIGGVSLVSQRARGGSSTDSNVICEPFNVQVKIKNPPEHLPNAEPMFINVACTPLRMRTTSETLPIMLNTLTSFTKALEFSSHRPFLFHLTGEHSTPLARRRWFFALEAILHQLRIRRQSFKSKIERFLPYRRDYISLLKRSRCVSWLPTLSEEEQLRLSVIEKELDFDQIVFLRCLATAELEEEERYVGSDRQQLQRFAEKVKPPSAARRGWGLSSWWSGQSPRADSAATDTDKGSTPHHSYSVLDSRQRVRAALARELAVIEGGGSISPQAEPSIKKQISLTADIPILSFTIDSSSLVLSSAFSNVSVCANLGDQSVAGESFRHAYQCEIGTAEVYSQLPLAGEQPCLLMKMQQPNMPWLTVGSDDTFSSIDAAAGDALFYMPDSPHARGMLAMADGISQAIKDAHISTTRASVGTSRNKSAQKTTGHSRAARVSLRSFGIIHRCLKTPNTLVAEARLLMLSYQITANGEDSVVLETTSQQELFDGVPEDAFSGLRVFLSDGAETSRLLSIEGTGLRASYSSFMNSLDLACGSLGGSWSWSSLMPLSEVLGTYSNLVDPPVNPTVASVAHSAEEPSVAPLSLRLAVYSFDFSVRHQERELTACGASREDKGLLTPWMYVSVSNSMEMRCEGLAIASVKQGTRLDSSLSAFAVNQSIEGHVDVFLGGASVLVCAMWLSVAEMILSLACCVTPLPHRCDDSSPNQHTRAQNLSFKFSITSPVRVGLAASSGNAFVAVQCDVCDVISSVESGLKAEFAFSQLTIGSHSCFDSPVRAELLFTPKAETQSPMDIQLRIGSIHYVHSHQHVMALATFFGDSFVQRASCLALICGVEKYGEEQRLAYSKGVRTNVSSDAASAAFALELAEMSIIIVGRNEHADARATLFFNQVGFTLRQPPDSRGVQDGLVRIGSVRMDGHALCENTSIRLLKNAKLGDSGGSTSELIRPAHGALSVAVSIDRLFPIQMSFMQYQTKLSAMCSNLADVSVKDLSDCRVDADMFEMPELDTQISPPPTVDFIFDGMHHVLSVSIESCATVGSMDVSIEGMRVCVVSSGDQMVQFGPLRICDNSGRKLVVPEFRIDDPRQQESKNFLPPSMPILTVSSIDVRLMNQPDVATFRTEVSIDTIFCTCLFESLRLLRDTFVPTQVMRLMPPRGGPSSEKNLSPPTPPQPQTVELFMAVKNVNVLFYEPWMERAGSVLVREVSVTTVNDATSSRIFVRFPKGVEAYSDFDGRRPLFHDSDAVQIHLDVEYPRPSPHTSSAAGNVPILNGLITVNVSGIHIIVHPQTLRMLTTVTNQLLPITELFAFSPPDPAPLKELPTVRLQVHQTTIEVVRCPSDTLKPFRVMIPTVEGSNRLERFEHGSMVYWRDVLSLNFLNVSMTPEIICANPESMRVDICRPLPFTATLASTREYVDFSKLLQSSDSRLSSPANASSPFTSFPTAAAVEAIAFESRLCFEFRGTLRVCREYVLDALRLASFYGSIPTFPASLRPRRDKFIRLRSSASMTFGPSKVELLDDAGEIALMCHLPSQTSADVSFETLDSRVTLEGSLLVSDATDMEIVSGSNARIEITSSVKGGASVSIGGLTAHLDLRRASTLLKVMGVVSPMGEDVRRFGLSSQSQPQTVDEHLSPDALHSALSNQQRSLKPSPPPFRIGLHNISAKIAHMASVDLTKASITVEASGALGLLIEELSLSDRRSESLKRVCSVSHMRMSADVGDVVIGVHSATLINDAIFFTDLASVLLHAYRSLLPSIKIAPKSEEHFKQSMTVDLKSCKVVFRSYHEGGALSDVDVVFPGLVIRSIHTTESMSTVIEAIDGSMGFSEGGAVDCRQALCKEIRFRLESSSSSEGDSVRLAVGKFVVSAPLGRSLQSIVSVLTENLAPYALWAKLLMRGTTSSSAANPIVTRCRSVQLELPCVAASLYDSSSPSSIIAYVQVNDMFFVSNISPDSEKLELRIGSITSTIDKSIQPDFIMAVPHSASDDRDATSNFGIFLRTQRGFDLSGSKASTIVRWGSVGLILSPQLIHLLDENLLRPAGLGVREASSKRESYANNESFTTVSSHEALADQGVLTITSDYAFSNDVSIGGPLGIRLHIARTEGSPNVIHLSSSSDVTVHLIYSKVRSIVVDAGISVYCNNIRFTTDAHFTHILDYVFCAERSFFHTSPGSLHARNPTDTSQGSDKSYATLSAGLKGQRQHAITWSIRGQIRLALHSQRDSFSISSDVEAEYQVSRVGEVIEEEKGFFGMPRLSVQCNEGVISKRPITLITHLEHHRACDDRLASTHVHVILDTTSIALTFDHAKLLYDTLHTIGPLVSRIGTLGSDIDEITSTTDPFAIAALHPVTSSLGYTVARSPNSRSQLSILINAPSFRFELVDSSLRSLGYAGVEGLAMHLHGSRDLSEMCVKASCSMRIVDLPYGHGGERVLLDACPEVVADVSCLNGGATKCEVAIAVPPVTITLPLAKLASALSYRFKEPARGPYVIHNETDLGMRVTIGDQTFDLDDYGSASVPIDGQPKVKVVLTDQSLPIIVDMSLERSEFTLPFLPTTMGPLIVSVSHATRAMHFSTGVTITSHLNGVCDPIIALRYDDAFGFGKEIQCLSGTRIVLPFASGPKPLHLSGGDHESTKLLPIEVLVGMARSQQSSLQFQTNIGANRAVIVRMSVEKGAPVSTEFPSVAFEVFPMGGIHNDSLFDVSLGDAEESMCLLTQGKCWNWFSVSPPTVIAHLHLSEGILRSSPVLVEVKKKLSISLGDSSSTTKVAGQLTPDSSADVSQCRMIFTCGSTLVNKTPFNLELFVRDASLNRDFLLAGLVSGKGLKPEARHPLGHVNGIHQIRLRSILPFVAASNYVTLGSLSTSLVSCVQGEGGQRDTVHVFSVSEKGNEVIVAPMWSVKNASEHALTVVTGSVSIAIAPLSVGGITTFPFKESADPSICFAFEGFSPSSPLHLASASQRSTTSLQQCLLNPLNEASKPACLTLSINRRSKRHILISASISEIDFPYEVENRTGEELVVCQKGQNRRVRIPPFRTRPFAFDTLTGSTPKVLVFETLLGKRVYQHTVDPELIPNASDGWTIAKGLYLTASTSSQKCTFSLVLDRLLQASYLHCPKVVHTVNFFFSTLEIFISSPVGHSNRTQFSKLAEEGILGITAKSNPGLFLSKREFDLLHVRIADVSANFVDNGHHRLLQSTVGEVSIRDVTWGGVKHSTLVIGKGNQDSAPWASLTLHARTDEAALSASALHLVALTSSFGNVTVCLNDAILHTLLAVGKELMPFVSLPPSPESPERDAACARMCRLRIDRILVTPISFILTYSRRSDGQYDPFKSTPLRHFITSIEAAPITLGEVSAVDYSMIIPEDKSIYTEIGLQLFFPVYRSSALLQSYKLIGSLEVLGNPIMFSSRVGEGVRDFVSSTLALNPIEGVSSLVTTAGSGFLHTCSLFSKVGGRLVGAASFDPQWLTDTNQSDGSSVIRGLHEGAVGVFTRPVMGARSGGLTGALTGLLAGASGAIAKPVSGAFFTVASAAEGASIALRRERKSQQIPESELSAPCRNVETICLWKDKGECLTPASTPVHDMHQKLDSEQYSRLGPRQVATKGLWKDFMALSSDEDFSNYSFLARDKHLACRAVSSTKLTVRRAEALRDGGGPAASYDAALERANHLRGTLGVSGMLKYVTLDQFVRCVGWEEARRSVPKDDFKNKVAPMMLRELERAVDRMAWSCDGAAKQ